MIALALMIAQAAASAQSGGAAPLPSVFGLQLGAAITLPECKRMATTTPPPGPKPPYMSDQQATCQQMPGEYGPGSESDGLVRFPPAQMPRIMGVGLIETTIIAGKLEAVSAATLSYNSAAGIIGDLTAKFGEPTERDGETVLVEKIAVPSVHVRWARPGYSVDYHSIAADDIGHGELDVETDAAKAAREVKARARDAQRTPL